MSIGAKLQKRAEPRSFSRFGEVEPHRTSGGGAGSSHSMKLSMPEMPPAVLLAALGSYNLLPAIVFMPTRRRCDQAASEAALHAARRER